MRTVCAVTSTLKSRALVEGVRNLVRSEEPVVAGQKIIAPPRRQTQFSRGHSMSSKRQWDAVLCSIASTQGTSSKEIPTNINCGTLALPIASANLKAPQGSSPLPRYQIPTVDVTTPEEKPQRRSADQRNRERKERKRAKVLAAAAGLDTSITKDMGNTLSSSVQQQGMDPTTPTDIKEVAVDLAEPEPFYDAAGFRASGHARLPVYQYTSRMPRATLLYIRDHEQANMELERLNVTLEGERHRIIGFDLEWRPSFSPNERKNPVALVQIASETKILLLQLSAMKMFPRKLIDILDDETILKAGVNILGDAQRLYRDFAATTRSCVELSYLARCVDRVRWPGTFRQLISLARLVHAYEGLSFPKGKTQLSNWEKELSTVQQNYAANDAHAAMTLCTKLLARAHHLNRSLFMFHVIQSIVSPAEGSMWPHNDPTLPLSQQEDFPWSSPPPRPPRSYKKMAVSSKKEKFLSAPRSRSSSETSHSAHEPGWIREKRKRSYQSSDEEDPSFEPRELRRAEGCKG